MACKKLLVSSCSVENDFMGRDWSPHCLRFKDILWTVIINKWLCFWETERKKDHGVKDHNLSFQVFYIWEKQEIFKYQIIPKRIIMHVLFNLRFTWDSCRCMNKSCRNWKSNLFPTLDKSSRTDLLNAGIKLRHCFVFAWEIALLLYFLKVSRSIS